VLKISKDKMHYSGGKYKRKQHWFDEECMKELWRIRYMAREGNSAD
jgi:hypothetical protein